MRVKGDPFQYSYSVEDVSMDKSRLEQSKEESSDGEKVTGRYQVLLPDGRLQTVTYTSGKDGYKAEVTYSQTSWKFIPSLGLTDTRLLPDDGFTRPSFVSTTVDVSRTRGRTMTTIPFDRRTEMTTTPSTTTTTMPTTTTTTTTTTTAMPIEQESFRTNSRPRTRLRTWEEARIRSLDEKPVVKSAVDTLQQPQAAANQVSFNGKKKMKTTWTFDRNPPSEFNLAWETLMV